MKILFIRLIIVVIAIIFIRYIIIPIIDEIYTEIDIIKYNRERRKAVKNDKVF